VSYVAVPPGYYYAQQPGTPWHEGGRGWEQSPTPIWADNPNESWPARQAVNGFGAAAPSAPPCMPPVCQPPPPPPRFTYVGRVPQQDYIRVGVAPWGNFASGPAYQDPRESSCPSCVGWPLAPGIGSIVTASRALQHGNYSAAARAAMQGLGAGCGPCEISAGAGCQTCPTGSDLPECTGCVDGQLPAEKRSLLEHPLAGPVLIGTATVLVSSIALYFAKRAKVPVAA